VNVTPIFDGRCKDGKVVFRRPLDWAKHVRAHEGLEVEVTLKKLRTQRSLKQNRAYFGIIVAAIADHCGYSKDEAHEALAFKFLRTGEPDALLPTRRSTASLTVQEFAAYQEQVKQFAAEELGLFIPDPGQVEL
jgi:predicted PhzF superfamily epimerase YddE/YHI9